MRRLSGLSGKEPEYLSYTRNLIQLTVVIVLSEPHSQKALCEKELKGEKIHKYECIHTNAHMHIHSIYSFVFGLRHSA